MFLRPNHRSKDGKDHTYWSLVETVRTPDGPRQKTLCHLGELNSSAQARWIKTIEVFNEQGETQQLRPRVKAHVMVAFLGYALWVTLKHLLKCRPALVPKPSASGVDNAPPLSPMRALALLSTLQSADIVLPTTDGHEIRLRRITEPTAEQKSLLRELGISLPERLLFDRKCSVDSAVA